MVTAWFVLSVAVMERVADADEDEEAVLRLTMAGQKSTGRSTSATTTLDEHVLLFPDVSDARHTNEVVPMSKLTPLAGVHDRVAGSTAMLSVVVKFHVATPVERPVEALTRIVGGQTTLGRVLSRMVTL